MGVNPVRNEVYAVNSGSDTVSVIDTTENSVAATHRRVHRAPYSMDVSLDGNGAPTSPTPAPTQSASSTSKSASGRSPSTPLVLKRSRCRHASPRTTAHLVVSNQVAGSVSIYSISDSPGATHCNSAPPSPAAPALQTSPSWPDSSKAFIACSGGHQVMDL